MDSDVQGMIAELKQLRSERRLRREGLGGRPSLEWELAAAIAGGVDGTSYASFFYEQSEDYRVDFLEGARAARKFLEEHPDTGLDCA